MSDREKHHGLLVIDKPEGITSHDVVARVRRILKTKRVGHTGTLDPFATGVMVLLVGQATRLAQFIDKDEKEYEAVIHFGFETDTGDKTGTRSFDRGFSDEEIIERLASVDWDEVLEAFRGEIEQVPPMYSAKKQAGKKLYEFARRGRQIEQDPIKVTIRELQIIDDGSCRGLDSRVGVRVVCSAGTYIRTLAQDIGRSIGIPAHLSELKRTRSGRFGQERGISLDTLEFSDNPPTMLISLEEAVSHLPAFLVPDDRVERTRNGLSTRTNERFPEDSAVQMLDIEGRLIAVGTFESTESQIKPNIVMS
jgi:tRNA pseudouridine55 synthase